MPETSLSLNSFILDLNNKELKDKKKEDELKIDKNFSKNWINNYFRKREINK